MSYGIKIRLEDGSEVEVHVKPKKFELAQHGDEGLFKLCVAWSKCKLHEDSAAAHAVEAAWPGRESVLLVKRDQEEPVFAGVVSAVGYDDELVFIQAIEDGGGPLPEPLTLSVAYDDADPQGLAVLVTVENDGEGEVTVDFGDGSPTVVHPGDGTAVPHAYDTAGTYTVSATDTDQPERTAAAPISVPRPTADLEVAIVADPEDPARMTAAITADNKGAGEVTVDFGDGSATVVNPGDGAAVTTHLYVAGTYTVNVTDADQPERTFSGVITVPFPA